MTIAREPMGAYKGFREKDFFNYIKEEYCIDNFTELLLENIVNYGQEFQHVSKGQFVHFLYDIIPFIELETILRFCYDDILTDDLLQLKYGG